MVYQSVLNVIMEVLQKEYDDMDNDKTVLVDYDDVSLEEAYRELGKAYYEGGFEDPLPELLPMFDKITRLRAQKGRREAASFCCNCGAKLEENSVFCGSCGCRVG